MTSQEHLDLLRQGVETWNQWRHEHEDIQPNLSGADLREANLRGADLSGTHLDRANLSEADLNGAFLSNADLSGANLSGANLSFSYLSNTTFQGAILSNANLEDAYLSEADLSGATVGWSIFGNLDLRTVKGLDMLEHVGPSTIGTDTISRSQGYLPEAFLRGAGVNDVFITAARTLAQHPIDYYPCFISYSNDDQNFAERLYADLQNKGVRCWFASEHMRIGDEIRTRIDESIRLYDKLLLVLSTHAIESSWVKHEVEAALDKEAQQQTQVLFPIRLDETVMHTNKAWAVTIRREKYIGDFTRWKQHDDYQQAFERLLRDLKAEERK